MHKACRRSQHEGGGCCTTDTSIRYSLMHTKRRHDGRLVLCNNNESGRWGGCPHPNNWKNTSFQLLRLHRAKMQWIGIIMGNATARAVFKHPSSMRFLPVKEKLSYYELSSTREDGASNTPTNRTAQPLVRGEDNTSPFSTSSSQYTLV